MPRMTRKERRAAEDARDEIMRQEHHRRVCLNNQDDRDYDDFNSTWTEDLYADEAAWDDPE